VYLVSAFAKGMESVMWVLVLWVIALYIFAVMARGFFGDDEKLRREVGGDVDTDLLFGTIPRCMVTLLGFYTYDATINIQRSIGEVYPVSWAFFMAFIVIVSIGIMELMTSLFIDALLEEKRRVEKVEQKNKDKRLREVQQIIKGLFDAFDDDTSGTLDKKELQECIKIFDDRDMRDMLDFVEIDPRMMMTAIKVADLDGDEAVSSEEFTAALESVHLPPMKCDIREVHQRVANLQRSVNVLEEKMVQQHEETTDRLEGMERMLASALEGKPPSSPDSPAVGVSGVVGGRDALKLALSPEGGSGADDGAKLAKLEKKLAKATKSGDADDIARINSKIAKLKPL